MIQPLEYSYDAERDVLRVNGVDYAGDLFRNFGLYPQDSERVFKLIRRDGPMVTVGVVKDAELSRRFDLIAGKRIASGDDCEVKAGGACGGAGARSG